MECMAADREDLDKLLVHKLGQADRAFLGELFLLGADPEFDSWKCQDCVRIQTLRCLDGRKCSSSSSTFQRCNIRVFTRPELPSDAFLQIDSQPAEDEEAHEKHGEHDPHERIEPDGGSVRGGKLVIHGRVALQNVVVQLSMTVIQLPGHRRNREKQAVAKPWRQAVKRVEVEEAADNICPRCCAFKGAWPRNLPLEWFQWAFQGPGTASSPPWGI